MRVHRLVCCAVCSLLLVPALSQAGEQTPTLVVRVRSLNDVLDHGQYFATLGGKGNLVKQMAAIVKGALGEEGQEGIDPRRPIGIYGKVDLKLEDLALVVMVPVIDDKTFLDFLDRFNLPAEKDKEGVYKVKVELAKRDFFFRLANKYAYVTVTSPDVLAKDKLLAPSRIQTGSDVLSATFRIDQIPDAVKTLVVGTVQTPLENAESEDQPGETAVQKAFRVQVLKELRGRLSGLLKEGEELNVGMDINRKSKEISLTASMNGKNKSKLAADIAELAQGTSLFAGFLGEQPDLGWRGHVALPAKLRKALEPVIDEGIALALASETDEGRKAVVKDFLGALEPSLKAAELDAAFSVRGTKGKPFTVVAGVKLKKGEELEKVFRKVHGLLPEAEQAKIKLDVATVGETKIHRLDVQEHYDAVAKEAFGDHSAYLAIRSDALLLAMGEGGLGALKKAIGAKAGVAPPFQLEVALGKILPLVPIDADVTKAAEKAFGKGAPGRIRLSLEGGKTLQLRLVAQLSVAEFLGELARLKIAQAEDK